MREPTESLDEGRITFDAPEGEARIVSVDPVCGRPINTAAIFTPKIERDGTTYGFCSPACRALFKANPTAYVEHDA